MEEQVKYQIYPSLLDSYSRFLKHDDEETFDSLMNKINKVPRQQSEPELRGVAFEDAVNNAIDGVILNTNNNGMILSGEFEFDPGVVGGAYVRLKNATKKQEYIEGIVETPAGLVKLYGIIDYRFPEMIADLKGRENYSYGKYADHAQHPVYSWISEVNGNPLRAFKYVVTDYQNVFSETYHFTDNDKFKLTTLIVDFIRFLEHFKKHITDRKIFGLEPIKL